MSTSTVLDLALDLAAHGLPVFPCNALKRPAIAKKAGGNGYLDATTDPDAVRALFARAPKAAMVGVPTGEASGIDALDIDYRHDGGLWEVANIDRLPETRAHRTMHGGRHYLFRHANGVFNTASKLAAGVDVRGTGGYIIMPPSGGYTVEADAEPAAWPDWLLELLLALKVKPAEPPPVDPDYQPRPIGDKGHQAWINGQFDNLRRAPDGTKHDVEWNTGLALGGRAVEMGIERAYAVNGLLAALEGRDVDDWDIAKKTAEEAFDAGLLKPLAPLPNRPGQRPRSASGGANGSPGIQLPPGTGNGSIHLPPPPKPNGHDTEAEAEPGRDVPLDDESWKEEPKPGPRRRAGITPLGFHQDVYYYLSRHTGRVFALKPDQHTRKMLAAMAGVDEYWAHTKFFTKNGRVEWHEAIESLLAMCNAVGWFDPDRLRGRGAWLDDLRVVINLGDRLMIDGNPSPLSVPGSRFIYPGGLRLAIGLEDAIKMSNAEASQLVDLCAGLRWERPISARLLAGWIVCALVCGALRWRPHIWVTGGAGSGKSWMMEQVVTPLLGPMALFTLSNTTEAGLRQTLGLDALAVVFDEFERTENLASDRVQAILDLIRQASSESGARIIKGTMNHFARSFRTRSAFCLSSINTTMIQEADETRFTVLALRPAIAGSAASLVDFDALQAKRDQIITPDYAIRLLARVVNLLPIISANSAVFARAISRQFGTRRAGDQLGTLLAGAYALHSTRQIDLAEAEDIVAKQDWGDAAGGSIERDEVRCLAYITAHRVGVTPPAGQRQEVPIGDLIIAAGMSYAFGDEPPISPPFAQKELKGYGLKYERHPDWGPGIWVSTSHPALARILKGTPWGHNAWSRALARLDGAKAGVQRNHRFGPGQLTKATWLPWTTILPNEEA